MTLQLLHGPPPVLSFQEIDSNNQGWVAPCNQRSLTIPQFKALLSELRRVVRKGPAGSKAEEAPHKNGKAIIPAEFDFVSPQCTCVPRKKWPGVPQHPFNVRYGRTHPDYRHRALHVVTRTTAMVTLDVDDNDLTVITHALDRMEADGLDFSAWSTHSYGRFDKGDKCPARIVVYGVIGVAGAFSEAAKVNLAEYYGLTLDDSTRHAVTLFYLPSCPDDDRRYKMAWIRHSSATGLLNIDTLVGEGIKRTVERQAVKRAAVKADLASGVKKAVGLLYCDAAESRLTAYCEALRHNREEHIRKMVLAAYYYGQFVGAGCLARQATEEDIQAALAERNEAVNDPNFADHEILISEMLDRGADDPMLPDLDSDADGVERLHAMLDASLIDHTVSPLSVGSAIAKLLAGRKERELLVIQVTAGGGKTHEILKDMAVRHARGQASLLLAPRHELLVELVQRVGVPSDHHRSPASVVAVDGYDNCKPDMVPLVKLAAAAKMNIKKNVCRGCKYNSSCPLYKRGKRPERMVHFGAWQLPIEAVTAHNENVSVYVDEMPEMTLSVIATEEDMKEELDFTYLQPEDCFPLVTLHKSWQAKTTPQAWDVSGARTSELNLRKGHDVEIALAHEPTLRTMRVLASMRVWAEGESVGKEVWTDLALHLKTNGGVVLSATPDRRVLGKLGARIETIHVADACPTTRQILYKARASRRTVLPNKIVDREAVEKSLMDALRLAREAKKKRVLIMSYKAVTELLDVDVLTTKQGFVEVDKAHYGNLTGLDKWKGFDAFITLFDPYPPSESREAQIDHARGELCQAHGRARDPNRKDGAWHLHVGQVAPLGWHSDNTVVIRVKNGRPQIGQLSTPNRLLSS